MIEELQGLIPEFAGSTSHTCCFLHIVNFITKSLIRQLDVKKMMVEDDELEDLQRELEKEEVTCQGKMVGANNNEVKEEVNNDEGLVDETEDMSDEKKNNLERSI